MNALFDNPIWFRERRAWAAQAHRRRWWRRWRSGGLLLLWVMVFAACALLTLAIDRRCELDRIAEPAGVFAMYLTVGYLVLRSLIAGGSGLVRERELQTMDTLVSSPLPARDLVVGKWMVAMLPLLLELLWALPVALAVGWMGGGQGDDITSAGIARGFLLSASLVVGLTGMGLAMSHRATASGKTATGSVMAGLALCGGTYVADLIVQIYLRSDNLVPVLCWLNPFTALWSAWAWWDNHLYYSSYSHQTVVTDHLWHVTALFYLGLGLLSVWVTWVRLRRPSTR
ncbi:MAG TPA: hypothetical protein VGO93_14255 [Candidatus Xenobia bacterium]